MPGNPLWNNVVLAMHMDGADGSTVFTDLKGSVFNRVGSPVISTEQSAFGGASARFDGASFIYTGHASRWLMDTRDFHLSMRFFIAGNSAPNASGLRYALLLSLDSGSSTSIHLAVRGNASSTGTGLDVRLGSTTWGATVSVSEGFWHDLELNRAAGKCSLALDGIQVATTTYASSIGNGDLHTLSIGGRSYSANSEWYLNGYIDDVIWIDGAALNTGAFIPSTAPFADGFEAFPQRILRPRAFVLPGGPPAWSALRLRRPTRLRDMNNDGIGQIVGTTKNIGDPNYPVSRRVRLYRKRDGVMARETWSDAAGNYVFDHLRHDIHYVVTAYDHTGLYNAVIADSMLPELMP